MTAYRAHDVVTADREAARAALAWPTQPAYLWGHAVLAAQRQDTAAALEALRSYAALGLGRDLHADTGFAALLQLPGFAPVVALHDANRAGLIRSRRVATLPDSTFWPEGMDVDPQSGSYYVTSVRHRTVAEVQTDGRVRELWPRDQAGLGAMLAVRIDPVQRLLWVTTSGMPQTQGYLPADSGIAACCGCGRPTASSSDAGISRRARAVTCWVTWRSARRAACSLPTRRSRCSIGCAPGATAWSRCGIRSFARSRDLRRRRTDLPSTWPITPMGCCGSTSPPGR